MTPHEGEETNSSPGFAARLAYVRFLKHLELGRPPKNVEIGRAANVKGEAVSNWIRDDRAPVEYGYLRGLANYFGAPIDWLKSGEDKPPDEQLWKRWSDARMRQPLVAEDEEEEAPRQRKKISPAVLPIREKPRASRRRKR